MNNQNHYRPPIKRFGSGSGSGGDPTAVLQTGQVHFRLLCHVSTAGGVIGNSGGLIRQLEAQTGCRIRFEEPLPNCHERVVNIIGDSIIDRKIRISYDGSNEEVEVVEVSRAQEGLIRVYERVLQLEGNGGAVGCRLLAISGQIGALMGKGGVIVDGIRKSTGAKIKVLTKEQLPACAIPGEELIQIMGVIAVVKRALVHVSRRLQVRLPAERYKDQVTSKGASHEQPADYPLDTKSSIQPLPRNAINHSSVAHSLSSNVDRVLNLDSDSTQRKVVFRLLCSYISAGGVIGKGAHIVKALEKDTGASIKFSTPTVRSKERVAIISSLEIRKPLYSPAQVATDRVFERSVEVSREHGHIKAGSISARILVGPHEVKCLLDEKGIVSLDIGSAMGVEVQLLDAENAPNCAAENDKIVQIIGEHDNVRNALIQLTGRLREMVFSSLVSEGAVPTNYSCSSRSESSKHEFGTSMPSQPNHLSSFSSLYQTDHLGFGPNLGGPHTLLQDKFKDRLNSKMGKPVKQSMGGWKSSHGGRESGRMDENETASKPVVINVPKQKFGSVYGEDGSNLTRLKEISGATVVLQDPGPGECDGKVIISGTPEQIQIAQSLLQAFIFL
ncbi:KH domain-containing protein HEN4-like isoform X1 [Solanum verrucosum]|uniref:KH domain-containing protein HEN4-like isoform X1 n=1 Tax=Solanum verrucosum TaxID=315347 RepID=UPI0020D0695D|nr:KH domain-containing protein HEN4-like isoform X1 [Solanum verrucosum]